MKQILHLGEYNMTYTYTKDHVSISRLIQEIHNSIITVALDYINAIETELDIIFKSSLTPDEKAILDLINSVELSLWWLLFKIFIAAIIVLTFKSIISSIVGYFIFRANKYISIGTNVNVDGFEGVIVKITLSDVVIENDKQRYVIPMTEVKSRKWVINKIGE